MIDYPIVKKLTEGEIKMNNNLNICVKKDNCIYNNKCPWDYNYRAGYLCFERQKYNECKNAERKSALKRKARKRMKTSNSIKKIIRRNR